MLCEYCSKEHDGSYATGRFCNRGCASGYCTRKRRKEINQKVSNSLTGRISPRRGILYSLDLTAEQREIRSKRWKVIQRNLADKKFAEKLLLWKEKKIQPGESSCRNILIFERGKSARNVDGTK